MLGVAVCLNKFSFSHNVGGKLLVISVEMSHRKGKVEVWKMNLMKWLELSTP